MHTQAVDKAQLVTIRRGGYGVVGSGGRGAGGDGKGGNVLKVLRAACHDVLLAYVNYLGAAGGLAAVNLRAGTRQSFAVGKGADAIVLSIHGL